jgi:hypothetical protein
MIAKDHNKKFSKKLIALVIALALGFFSSGDRKNADAQTYSEIRPVFVPGPLQIAYPIMRASLESLLQAQQLHWSVRAESALRRQSQDSLNAAKEASGSNPLPALLLMMSDAYRVLESL